MKLFILFIGTFVSLSALASGYTFISELEHQLHISEHMLTFGFVSFVLIFFGFMYRTVLAKSNKAVVPDSGITFRNIYEGLGQFIYNLCVSIMGEKEAKKYFTCVVLVFTFVFLSNVIGLIPGFLPPTDNINTTLGFGLFVFLYYNYHGIKEQGLVGHIKHFMGPVWYLAPLIFVIEIISHCVRPLSLALRLRGNMYGDHLVLSIFSDLVPIGVPVIFLFIGLFVCFVQAFVFSLLSMVYISLATESHDHDDSEAHH